MGRCWRCHPLPCHLALFSHRCPVEPPRGLLVLICTSEKTPAGTAKPPRGSLYPVDAEWCLRRPPPNLFRVRKLPSTIHAESSLRSVTGHGARLSPGAEFLDSQIVRSYGRGESCYCGAGRGIGDRKFRILTGSLGLRRGASADASARRFSPAASARRAPAASAGQRRPWRLGVPRMSPLMRAWAGARGQPADRGGSRDSTAAEALGC